MIFYNFIELIIINYIVMNDCYKVKNIIMLIIYIKLVLVNINLKVLFKLFFIMIMYVCIMLIF